MVALDPYPEKGPGGATAIVRGPGVFESRNDDAARQNLSKLRGAVQGGEGSEGC